MKRRKWAAAGLALVLVLMSALSAGCGTKTEKEQGKREEKSSRTDREALTILMTDKVTLEENLKEQFPDIPFDIQYYDGKNMTANTQMLIENQDIPDIFLGMLPLREEEAEKNLLDLSGYELCDRYDLSVLKQYDMDGKIYQLPSAMVVRSIIYNKKMFEEHGWQEPQTFGELTELCRQIRRETEGITPIVFGGAGIGYYFTTMTTYAQSEFLYTSQGRRWEREYQKGNAKAEEGFGKGIQMVQELIDAGAFDYEQNKDLWDAKLFQELMESGQAAMQFAWGTQHKLVGLLEGREQEFGMMPFRNYEGDAFLGTAASYNIGLSKRLGEKGNEKKLENALRVMEYLGTEEAQSCISGGDRSMIFTVKGSENSHMIPQYREVWEESLDGIKAPMMYAGYEDIIVPTANYIVEAIKGERDLSGLASYIDEVHHQALEQKKNLGVAAEDFTHRETVQMIAEILQSRKDSDITLVSDGERNGKVPNENGAHSRFYKGDINDEWIYVFAPGDSAVEDMLVQMTLTGAQIRELLEGGKQVVQYEDGERKASASDENAVLSSVYDYYWAGMTAELADGKVLSMKLADGTPMEDEKTYTVTFAHGDYMDTTESAGSPKELGCNVDEVFAEYLKEHSPIEPMKVQRQGR